LNLSDDFDEETKEASIDSVPVDIADFEEFVAVGLTPLLCVGLEFAVDLEVTLAADHVYFDAQGVYAALHFLFEVLHVFETAHRGQVEHEHHSLCVFVEFLADVPEVFLA